nr:ATP synthase F0 subunit 8 [Matsucoccus matsumurae]WBG67629.1 ATP synthase F0 subunit 8 [Matsucoccus matsumurae]WRQ20332.1 ATP synthase F0 subunit 8 [Matsucoccus matsumurae]
MIYMAPNLWIFLYFMTLMMFMIMTMNNFFNFKFKL